MNAVEVKGLVQESLGRHQEPTKPIRVVSVDEEPIDGQWQVLVEPLAQEPTPRYYYYEMLGEVEDELAQRSVSVFSNSRPEATYRYEIDDEPIDVRRRESILFVTSPSAPHVSSSYTLAGESHGMGFMNMDDQAQLHAKEVWGARFDRARDQYLDEKRRLEESGRSYAFTAS